jgi:hypothetical protein
MSDQKNPQDQESPKIQRRHLPVRPNLDQLKRQAKDLLRAIRRRDPAAIAEFNQYYPKPIQTDTGETPTTRATEDVKLTEAQLALARSY